MSIIFDRDSLNLELMNYSRFKILSYPLSVQQAPLTNAALDVMCLYQNSSSITKFILGWVSQSVELSLKSQLYMLDRANSATIMRTTESNQLVRAG